MKPLKTITITLTEYCNLACTYCYEHHKTDKSMDFDTLKYVLTKELTDIDQYEKVEFDLFGGEPFVEFELIKQIDEYVESLELQTDYVFFVSTNGTLVHGEIQSWLRERKDYFICGLSYDGTMEMQNINRSNSADDIDLDFFSKTYPLQTVKMTISVESLKSLADGVIFLHSKGFKVSCNLAYNIDWSDYENQIHLERELGKLIEFYLCNPQIEPCSMLNMPISSVASSMEKKKILRYCGAGLTTKAYHVDGTLFPCQFFMPVSIGKEKSIQSQKLHFYDEAIPEELVEEKCKNCVIQAICPNCFGANFSSTGDMYKRDDNYCKLTKLIIRARSYFKAKQWELGQLNLSSEEENSLLRSIRIIQNELY